jgi:hypothetical protein
MAVARIVKQALDAAGAQFGVWFLQDSSLNNASGIVNKIGDDLQPIEGTSSDAVWDGSAATVTRQSLFRYMAVKLGALAPATVTPFTFSSTGAANSLEVTAAAVSGKTNVLKTVAVNYNNPPNGAAPLVAIKDGATTVASFYAPFNGPPITFPDGLPITLGAALNVILTGADATVNASIVIHGRVQ